MGRETKKRGKSENWGKDPKIQESRQKKEQEHRGGNITLKDGKRDL